MMIKYARRKKKRDLFVIWMAVSAVGFLTAGATLRGVSAVKGLPVLVEGEPVAIPVELVSIDPDPQPAAGSPDVTSKELAAGPSPFDTGSPFDLAPPEPIFEPEPTVAAQDDPAPVSMDLPDVVEEPVRIPPPDIDPTPPVEEVKPPEPAPEPKQAATPAKPKATPSKPKTQSRPPTPKKTTSRPKKTTSRPKTQSRPPAPRPAPKATATTRNPRVATQSPKVLWRPKLRFPTEAKQRGIGGSLTLSVTVGTNGRASKVRVKRSSGHRVLDNEAIAAVKAWRFDPAKNVFGKPVANTITVPVNFGYARPN